MAFTANCPIQALTYRLIILWSILYFKCTLHFHVNLTFYRQDANPNPVSFNYGSASTYKFQETTYIRFPVGTLKLQCGILKLIAISNSLFRALSNGLLAFCT